MTPLAGRYDFPLVTLSVLIAVLAAGAALDLASRVTAARGRFQALWLTGGALAMGLGIWSMHYTGMLAFRLPIPVYYHVPTVALSLLAAVGASGVALYIASRDRLDPGRVALGSIAMGSGIAAMHYIGMAAMRLTAEMVWNVLIVAASVGIAIAVSAVALWFAFRYGRPTAEAWTWRKGGSAGLMGIAIPAMHHTGMAAATFWHADMTPDPTWTVDISTLGAYAIAGGTLLVLAMAIGTSFVSRYGQARLRASEARLAEAQAIAHLGSWELDVATHRVTWSDESYRIYGIPLGTPIGYDAFVERLHPEDRQRVDRMIAHGMATHEPGTYEFRVIRPDGEIRHVHGRYIVITDAAGTVTRLAGASLDVTERIQAAENQRTLLRELQASIAEVKVLRGMLAICASCKRIRGENGEWEPIESYVRDHTNAEFSHGLCPDCAARDWGASPTIQGA